MVETNKTVEIRFNTTSGRRQISHE